MKNLPVKIEGIPASKLPDLYDQFVLAVTGDAEKVAALKELQPIELSRFELEINDKGGRYLRLWTDRQYTTRTIVGGKEHLEYESGIVSALGVYREGDVISSSTIYPYSVANHSGVPELKHTYTTMSQSGVVETLSEDASFNIAARAAVAIIEAREKLLNDAHQKMLRLAIV